MAVELLRLAREREVRRWGIRNYLMHLQKLRLFVAAP